MWLITPVTTVIMFLFAVMRVPFYMMRFLPTFEPVVMSFVPAAGRFSGDDEVSTCSGEVSTRRMRFSPSSRW